MALLRKGFWIGCAKSCFSVERRCEFCELGVGRGRTNLTSLKVKEKARMRASYVKVADSTAFWRENDNLLIFHINSDNWSCSGMP